MVRAKRSRLERFFIRANRALRGRSDGFLARRPHRSFRRTRRRDYVRSFAVPGYVALTRDTFGLLIKNRRLFLKFFLTYSIVSAIALGVANQANYAQVSAALRSSTPNEFLGTLTLFGAAITGSLNPAASQTSGILSSLLIVLGWLVMIWLLRHVQAGTKVRLREGLYNAGAPLIPTVLVSIAAVVQIIPMLLVSVGTTAASSTGLLSGGVETMLFVVVAVLLVTLSLYWLTSTFIALVVVTLPGMYPWAAIRAAGDLVVGRRVRLLLRLVWFAVLLVLVWALILIPVILLDGAIKVDWLPLVPLAILGLSSLTLVLASTYIYQLYRKLVDDGTPPA